MFFFERGEIMANEAINHVVQVERTIAKIRQDAEDKIGQINLSKQEELDKICEELKREIKLFKLTQHEAFENDLKSNREANKQSIQSLADRYEDKYNEKREELSNYIVKEVLKRYGS